MFSAPTRLSSGLGLLLVWTGLSWSFGPPCPNEAATDARLGSRASSAAMRDAKDPRARQPSVTLGRVTRGKVDFGRDVRPILSDRCFACHGPDAKTRKAGLRLDTQDGSQARLEGGRFAIVPGDSKASEILRRVSAHGKERMPPEGSGEALTANEVATLRAWIDAGAEYSAHWAFVVPERPPLPQLEGATSPIDAFVRARLAAEGLRAAPEADRATLLRRVSLDLTGLPPSPSQVEAFVRDKSPKAYERQVERLLASPQHAEHMARHWLDAARYGDTHGYHLDNRRQIWPYRDWVIEAYRSNLRFDDFVRKQIAGDLLPEATREDQVASGFNRCNVTSAEGGMIAAEYLAKYAMDRVETTATVFLGLTTNCARCHDHKFDPLTQRDYYRMFAFFNSIAEDASDKNQPVPPPSIRVPSVKQESELARIDREIEALEARLTAPMPEVDAAQAKWEVSERAKISERWTVLRPTSALSQGGATLRVQADGSILASGHEPDREVYEVSAISPRGGIRALRLEALTHNGKGPGRSSHRNIVLSRFEVLAAPLERSQSLKAVALEAASADYNQINYHVRGALDSNDATGWAFSNPKPPLSAVFIPKQAIGEGATLLRLRLHFVSPHPKHALLRFRLSESRDDKLQPATLSAWHRLGPIRGKSFVQAYANDFGPERGVQLDKPQAGQRWIKSAYAEGKVHLFAQTPNAATYLYRRIEVASARELQLGLGSDDAIKVWLDGRLIHQKRVARGVTVDQDRVSLRLSPGSHELLIKIVNAAGGHGFAFRLIGESPDGLPIRIVEALSSKKANSKQSAALRAYYRRRHSPGWKELDAAIAKLRAERKRVEAEIPQTLVSKELPKPRPAHILDRGQYDRKREIVQPGTPSALHELRPRAARATRLDLAEWLVARDNPLTARVTVNRLWQMFFGTGIVKTAEDFGMQGEWPSHPELLDWLACEFVEKGWDVRHILRTIVSSATYRQSARASAALVARDPQNRLLARGPRHRLDAEAIRDQALFVSGLLVDKVGGPSVRPYQPPGVWFAVGYTSSNTARFKRDSGEKLWRRSLYTFWKRTAPPPTMQLFDAPSREACRVRRARTNTPLQALALMNDVQFVEAARAFAERILMSDGDLAEQLAFGFRWVTSRVPSAPELAELQRLFDEQVAQYRSKPDAAKALLSHGEYKVKAELPSDRLAAMTIVANLLLNLDEAITKG